MHVPSRKATLYELPSTITPVAPINCPPATFKLAAPALKEASMKTASKIATSEDFENRVLDKTNPYIIAGNKNHEKWGRAESPDDRALVRRSTPRVFASFHV
jgi:hypothetical protein